MLEPNLLKYACPLTMGDNFILKKVTKFIIGRKIKDYGKEITCLKNHNVFFVFFHSIFKDTGKMAFLMLRETRFTSAHFVLHVG